jgi:ABC-type transport system substrate-binding protein
MKNLFPENMLSLPIIPKHIWKDVSAENHTSQAETWALTNPSKLIGTGPYYLYDFNSETTSIHLKRNDYYKNWTGLNPHFEDIIFKLYSNKELALLDLSNGAVDVVDTLFSINKEEVPENASYTLTPSGKVQQLAINNLHPYLGTGNLCPIADESSALNIRKAISHIIPRDTIANEIYNGLAIPAATPWLNSALDFDDSLAPYTYDLEQAQQYMIDDEFWPICHTPTTTESIGNSLKIFTLITSIVIISIQLKSRRNKKSKY